ncbi:arsenic resistance N-acetyltransferase ArsN2 [Mucilaginibacter sabulilitoris]|uniref:Arsenic resistance N-acetyltransferase ArsN2 n=1 Tax=Mucilaginibacter sabulilitoris TaxID=1173583 RepID=A0ABZ0TV90_9SPHI|nr:arsenic resistance N-acetyltransferase ArsN2 [Mucilaginibacter sabulilitoris]WPU95360.1 arsenic resistance N-acetyltransferase ArsN2 [Mucilaginibacter sabulilitoris]
MQIKPADNYRENIVQMLNSAKLPAGDLPESLANFLVALNDDGIVMGTAGLEVYGDDALLRSLVVLPKHRGKGVANHLITEIENLARHHKVNTIYLLTETAQRYFSRKAYHEINREAASKQVQASSEFSHVCPVSAVVMKKQLI